MNLEYIMITGTKQLSMFSEDLKLTNEIGFDLETSGLDWIQDKIRLAQFEVNDNIYIINLDDNPKKSLEYLIYVLDLIVASNKNVIGHNIKFDLKFILRKTGIILENVYDTQIAEMILTSGVYGRQHYFSLAELVKLYSGVELDKETRMLFVTSEVITDDMIFYSVQDVKYLKKIKRDQLLEASKVGMSVVFDVDMKLIPIVARMEYDGLLLDLEAWLVIAKKYSELVDKLKPEIVEDFLQGCWNLVSGKISNGIDAYKTFSIPLPKAQNSKTGKTDLTFLEGLTNEVFILKHLKEVININSHNQLKKLLHLNEFYIPDEEFGRILVPNTQTATLELLNNHEVIQKLLEYKDATKRVSTYGENWKEYIHPVTGRIHPEYNQVGTVTGRWTASNPSPQTIPLEHQYRSCFIAREGHSLATADYSQAELRFVGALSQEPEIIQAYINGEDIHIKTASIIYGKAMEDVTPEERGYGKTVNFSILYGSTAYGLSQKNTDISIEQAEELLEKFFLGYPVLAGFIRDKSNEIWSTNKSLTPMGRIRYLPKLENDNLSDNEIRRHTARLKREGFNHIVQGGSADSLKLAMVYAYYNKPFEHDDFRFLIQVHDELVVEIKDEILDEAIPFLLECMEKAEQVFLEDIPAKADCNVEKYWSK